MELDLKDIYERAEASQQATDTERNKKIAELHPVNSDKVNAITESLNRAYTAKENKERAEAAEIARAKAEAFRKEAEKTEAHKKGIRSTDEEEERAPFRTMLNDIMEERDSAREATLNKYATKEAPQENKPRTEFSDMLDKIEEMRAQIKKDMEALNK